MVSTNAAHSSSTSTLPDEDNAGWELCTQVRKNPPNRVFYVSCRNEDGAERYPLTAQFGVYAEDQRFMFTEVELYEYDEQSSKSCLI